jgi:hypothetical protein
LRQRSPSGWPVWILFAAWLCANSPQDLTFSVMGWVGNARHFSHQERLKSEVAFILSGRKPESVALSVKPAPARPLVPPVVTEVVLKKIDLYVSLSAEPAPPGSRGLGYRDQSELPPDSIPREPLSPPPRAGTIA